uniref:Channel forming colicins domain-containing protein n=1 Tax=Anguilla anguilla TaxID=7936 RepID=A0A0E9T388_ANGAN
MTGDWFPYFLSRELNKTYILIIVVLFAKVVCLYLNYIIRTLILDTVIYYYFKELILGSSDKISQSIIVSH